jgi:hypothetical protein
MEYFKNQHVNIIEYNGGLKVISKQKKSTPGIYFRLELESMIGCQIKLTGHCKKNNKVRLWIIDTRENNKIVEYSDDYEIAEKMSTLEYYLENKSETSKIYKVGLLFCNPRKNSHFILTDFNFKKSDEYKLKNVVKYSKYMSNYLYVYYYKPKNGHYNSIWQLYIKEKIQDYMETKQLTEITPNIVNKYEVIILDYFAIARYNPLVNKMRYLNILAKGKKIVLYLHDMHEYTFCDSSSVRPKSHLKNAPLEKPGEGVKNFVTLLKKYNIQYLISRCECKEFYNIIEEGEESIKDYYFIPHHINPSLFKDYKINKKYDIILYGAFNKKTYPFRARLKKIIINSGKFKVQWIYRRRPVYNETLSKVINNSWIGISSKSNFDYLVCKYFEISASNCVIAGNMSEQGKSIWNNNYIKLEDTMSDEEIIAKLEYYLNNKHLLTKMMGNMYKKIHNNYTYEHLSFKMNAICETIDPTNDIQLKDFNNIPKLEQQFMNYWIKKL